MNYAAEWRIILSAWRRFRPLSWSMYSYASGATVSGYELPVVLPIGRVS